MLWVCLVVVVLCLFWQNCDRYTPTLYPSIYLHTSTVCVKEYVHFWLLILFVWLKNDSTTSKVLLFWRFQSAVLLFFWPPCKDWDCACLSGTNTHRTYQIYIEMTCSCIFIKFSNTQGCLTDVYEDFWRVENKGSKVHADDSTE